MATLQEILGAAAKGGVIGGGRKTTNMQEIATALAKLAKRRIQAGSTQNLGSAPQNNNRGGGGGPAIPADPFAGLDTTNPVIKDLIDRKLITPGMDPAKLAALIQMGGLRAGIPADIAKLMAEINANYDNYTGDILTAGSDWMQQLYGDNSMPPGFSMNPDDPGTIIAPAGYNYANGQWTDANGTVVGTSPTEDSRVTPVGDPNAALFAQDPIFSSYAGGMAQIDETADLNRATDLAWFDKQQAAMQGYYDMLMQQVSTAQPEAGGGGGGGGGGRGGGYGGGGGGDGDSEGGMDIFTDPKTVVNWKESDQMTGYENSREDFPGYVRGMRNTFQVLNPEFAQYMEDILNTNSSNPEAVADALTEERIASEAQLEEDLEGQRGNAVWLEGIPEELRQRLQQFAQTQGIVMGDNPGTENYVEGFYTPEGTVPSDLGQMTDPNYAALVGQNRDLFAQAYDPLNMPGGLAGRDLVVQTTEATRQAALRRLLHPEQAAQNSAVPPQVQQLLGNATGQTPSPAAPTMTGPGVTYPVHNFYPSSGGVGGRGNEYGGLDISGMAAEAQINEANAAQNFSGPDEVIRLLVNLNRGTRNPELIAQILRDSENNLRPEWMDEINNWVRIHSPESFSARGDQESTSYDPNDLGPFVGNYQGDVTTPGQDVGTATADARDIAAFPNDTEAIQHYAENIYPNLSMLQRMAVDEVFQANGVELPTQYPATPGQNRRNVSTILRNAISGGRNGAVPGAGPPGFGALQNIGGISQLLQNATAGGQTPATPQVRDPNVQTLARQLGGGSPGFLGAPQMLRGLGQLQEMGDPFTASDATSAWQEGAITDDNTVRENLLDKIKELSSEPVIAARNAAGAAVAGGVYTPPEAGTYWNSELMSPEEYAELERKVAAIRQGLYMNDQFNPGVGMVNVRDNTARRIQEAISAATTATSFDPAAAQITGMGDPDFGTLENLDVVDQDPGAYLDDYAFGTEAGTEADMDYVIGDESNLLGSFAGNSGGRGRSRAMMSPTAGLINDAIKRLNQPKPAYTAQSLGSSIKNMAQNRMSKPAPANADLARIRSMLSGVQNLSKLRMNKR